MAGHGATFTSPEAALDAEQVTGERIKNGRARGLAGGLVGDTWRQSNVTLAMRVPYSSDSFGPSESGVGSFAYWPITQ